MYSLKHLLVHEIQDLYSGGTQFFDALPLLAEKANHPDLKAALQLHYIETIMQLERLERVAEILEVQPVQPIQVVCKGMRGLIREASDVVNGGRPAVVDAGLIGATQKVEHYEMAGYGTARAHAERLGLIEVARMLQQTLEEKAAANDKLTVIAESGVNQLAIAG